MASLKNGIYRDVMSSRGGRDSALSFAGNFDIKIKATDPSFARPPEYYEYDRFVDRVFIGDHFGFQFQLTFSMILKGSADVPDFGYWRWTFVCDVDIVYPDGFVKSGRITLGSELVDPLLYHFKDVSFPITFNSTTIFESVQYVDIDENGAIYPPRTFLRLFEQIPMDTRQDVSVTVTGLTGGSVSDNVHELQYISANTEYQFTIDTKLHSYGATAGIQSLDLSPLTINELALPDYNYFHFIDGNNYFLQTTAVDSKVVGADNAFGEPQYRFIEANTLVTLERNIDVEAIIHAWQDSYPDNLSITATTTGVGGDSTSFTASGGFGTTSRNWKNYSFVSNISGTTNSLIYSNLPASDSTFRISINPTSLAGNGDTTIGTRIPFRGWWETGADIYHAKNTVIPGSGNTRTFSEFTGGLPLQNFSAYRYLNITAGNATTTPQTTTLLIKSPFDNGFQTQVVLEKQLTWNPGTSTKTIDLCFAGIAHTNYPDIQLQDNPYPRPNGLVYDAYARYINQDFYGIGCVKEIETQGSVTVSEYKLTRPDNTAKASFVAGLTSVTTPLVQNNAPWARGFGNSQIRVRRFWEQDVSGKNEEEYDLQLSPPTLQYYGFSIQEICSNIQSRPNFGTTGGSRGFVHQGWTATPTGPTTGDLIGTNLGWFQPGAAWASWLNGFGLQAIAGTRTYSILRDLSQESGDREIYAQQVFDRINSRFPPDYFDAFQIESPGYPALKLVGFAIQRAAIHGLVQEELSGEVVDFESTGGSFYGQGITDITGSYQTGLPYGKAENSALVTYLTNNATLNKIYTSKRTRVSFYVLPVPSTLIVLSADISGFYQGCIGTIESGVVKLVFTSTPDFSTFDILPTNITGMSNVAIAWNHPTNSNEMILIAQRTSDSAIIRYELDDFVNGVAGMGTVIGNGTTPAIAINNNGTSIIFWRTSSSNIQRIIIDSAGNISTAASNVIVGNVENLGLGTYWLDDQVFLVYNHTVNGLTVVKSDDYGETFS